jgi:hypothetical protein
MWVAQTSFSQHPNSMSAITDQYDQLDEEPTEFCAIARCLHGEGDVGIAAKTNVKGDQITSRREEILDEGIMEDARRRYAS